MLENRKLTLPLFIPALPAKKTMTYYSQNDPRWKGVKIGKSPYTLGQKGCTLSCIADGGSWFGEEIAPQSLASKLAFLDDGRVLWGSISTLYKKMRFEWRFYSPETSRIDEGLKNPKKVVLLNVDRGGHWVFAKYKIPLVGYMTSDPFPFPAKNRLVRTSEIVGGAILIAK